MLTGRAYLDEGIRPRGVGNPKHFSIPTGRAHLGVDIRSLGMTGQEDI